ncbi:hypothetical protein O9993_03395 [Vibrio lentus]|nr:hypothetical protein [Vibrio lentus]
MIAAVVCESKAQEHHAALIGFNKTEEVARKPLSITYITHEEFKERRIKSRGYPAQVNARSYANVIFKLA